MIPQSTGSQGNPIDVSTPLINATPRLPSQAPPPYTPAPQIPQLQPAAQIQSANEQQAAQIAALRQQQLQQQQPQPRAPSFSGGQSGQQMQPQFAGNQGQPIQPQASAAGQGQGQGQGQVSKKPWLGMDFRDEPLPMNEEQMWETLKKLLKSQNLPPPVIEGKPVSVYALFNLVHRNGGSAKVSEFSTLSHILPFDGHQSQHEHRDADNGYFLQLDIAGQNWSLIAGHLGLGTSIGEQPARSSPQVAQQLRQVYAHYLAQFEDIWYQRLYGVRSKQLAAAQQAQAQGGGQGQGIGQAQPQGQGQAQGQGQMGGMSNVPLSIAQHGQNQQGVTNGMSAAIHNAAFPPQQPPPANPSLAHISAILQQQQQQQGSTGQPQGPGQNQGQLQPAQMSAQFLDAMAKNSALTEQQKRYIEEARRQSISLSQAQAAAQQLQAQGQFSGAPGQGQGQGQGQGLVSGQAADTSTPSIQAPQLPHMPGQVPQGAAHQAQAQAQGGQFQGQGQAPTQQAHQAMIAQQAAMILSAMQGLKTNPSVAYAWMRSKEDTMRAKFREWRRTSCLLTLVLWYLRRKIEG
jgi:hypothetical protein